VHVSQSTFDALPNTEEDTFLEVYHHFSEAEQRLFGFSTKDEKALFELIITVKGIGPRLGLAVLSGLPPDQLIQAISSKDVGMLSSISGIGKKTAERIVLELKEKVDLIETSSSVNSNGVNLLNMSASTPSKAYAGEAISALEALGYRKAHAMKAVQEALSKAGNEIDGAQALIKKALIFLNN
jgi:Holliday junction DNA helicase RuvA